MAGHVLGIDQSTQGTKALLFDADGVLVARADAKHEQMVDEHGWVEHNPDEIWDRTLEVVRKVVEAAGIDKAEIRSLGISNQRETVLAWDRESGKPVYNAIVWQCGRAASICEELEAKGLGEMVHEHTGLRLSPYFSAAKLAWILRNVPGAMERTMQGSLAAGTIDSWLIYNLTDRRELKTDRSNAARTQLFNIHSLEWDQEICDAYGVPTGILPEVVDSNALFGTTTLGGFLDAPIPIHGVLGDSNGALFGQRCLEAGNTKATYGTGTSVMMNTGDKAILSDSLATSLAWSISGRTAYVLEGNINYSGAVIEWLRNDAGLIKSAAETGELARAANPADTTYLVPAFSGLSAPYWDAHAKALICGMTRTTGRAEIVKAGLESIAYQIRDVVVALEETAGFGIDALRVDGGATKNSYLMAFQSDILGKIVRISQIEELSGLGAAYMAGLGSGLYSLDTMFDSSPAPTLVEPSMDRETALEKCAGWKAAVQKTLA